MERLKQKESKTIHMKFPTPYSQSWAGIDHQRKSFSSEKTSSKIYNSPRVSSQHPRKQEPQPSYSGLDPTVPHLKYGLFPKKLYISRGQPRTLPAKPPVRTTSQPADGRSRPASSRRARRVNEQPRGALGKTPTIQKFLLTPRAQGELSAAPPLGIRPLARSVMRSLSVSASTHLDIKPRPPRGPARAPLDYKRYF